MIRSFALGLAFLICCGFVQGQGEESLTPGASSGYNYTDDPNCIGAWRMANSGNETDVSGNGVTLTEITAGDIPTSSDVPAGYSGTSRDFEYGDQEVLATDDANLTIEGNQDFSFCAWVKAESAVADGTIAGQYYTGTNDRQWRLAYRSGDAAAVGYASSDGSTYSKAVGATNIADDSWHHVCKVFDYDAGGSTLTLYVDGSEDTNGSDNPKSHSGGIYAGDAWVNIGGMTTTAGVAEANASWDGLIKQAILFNRTLNATEIGNIYSDGMEGVNGAND